MNVIEATIRTRGEITFTSREVGRLSDTEPYVLNTALYYAFGLAGGRYLDSSYEPTYVADTSHVASEVYVSPAAPVSDRPPRYVTTTYNATRDEYAVVNYAAEDDPYEKRNLPSFGRRRSLAQGTRLRCYVVPRDRPATELASSLPNYVRLGKKRGKARLDLEVRDATERSGSFELGHPIGAYDHEEPPVANVVTKSMKPTPLIIKADYDGPHIRIDRSDAGTGSELVDLPRELTFLKTRR